MKKLGFGCMRFPMRDQKIDMQELKHIHQTGGIYEKVRIWLYAVPHA